jgi:hypothetical protein
LTGIFAWYSIPRVEKLASAVMLWQGQTCWMN